MLPKIHKSSRKRQRLRHKPGRCWVAVGRSSPLPIEARRGRARAGHSNSEEAVELRETGPVAPVNREGLEVEEEEAGFM